jgi:3-hydroxyacyl-[acyl-carrier-protein] dehydratase
MRLEYFRMVDRIETLDVAAGHIVAECQVPDESPVFEGHFPGYPILPGTLMIEAMAQTGGWLVLALHHFTRMAFLMQVEKAKIRTFVSPGTTIQVQADLVHDGSGYAVARTSITATPSTATSITATSSTPAATSTSRKVADAEIRFGVVPFPKPGMQPAILANARQLGISEDLLHGA